MIYAFEDFELDPLGYELRRGGEPCAIEPQVFDVLTHLVRHRDRVVTKRELLDEVWGHRFVEESTLSSRIMAARKAVGDDGRAQRVIKTVHGRGFRFLPEVMEREPAVGVGAGAAEALPHSDMVAAPRAGPAIGREGELELLAAGLERAQGGRRSTIFVTGDPGLGKTTLVEAFLAAAREREPALGIARGQCLEHVGPGEPYGPVLEAIGRLSREPAADGFVELLDRGAPAWLVQLPALVDAERLEPLQRRTVGQRPMPRELAEALDEWTATRPLVLVLEDLHWSDPSTVDLLGWLARREEPARLLLIGTLRAAEARSASHPLESLRRDLAIRSLCDEIALEPLEVADVERILAARLPGAEETVGLAALVHARSGGNPLFVAGLLEAWVQAGAIARQDGRWSVAVALETLALEIPETLRLLVEDRLDRLEPEGRELLAAAAVAGVEFASTVVAAGVGRDEDEVETRLDRLARQGAFLTPREPLEAWDGTVSARFGFTHQLYPQVLYQRIPPGRRARLHQRIGTQLEALHGPRAVDRAAELAVHFVRGGDPVRAIRYLRLAAENAMRRGAPREAVKHLTAGLELIGRRHDLPGRERLEHAFRALLGTALLMTEGWAAEEAEASFRRAYEIGERLGEDALRIPALYGLAVLLEYRAEYARSQEIMEEVLGLGPQDGDLRVQVHELLACSLFHQGAFADAVETADRGLAAVDPERPSLAHADFGDDSAMSCHAWAGLASWFLGRWDEALERAETAVRLARGPGRAYCLANALSQAARVHHLRRDVARTRAAAAEAIALADRQGIAYFRAVATVLDGWARAMEGDDAGIEEIERGVAAHQATGAAMDRPYFLGILAEALDARGRSDEALAVVREAIAAMGAGRSFFDEPELIRLEGELLLRTGGGTAGAEARFRRAIERARELGACGSELRAAIRLARLWRTERGDAHGEETRRLLEPLVAAIEGGEGSPDLLAAAELLRPETSRTSPGASRSSGPRRRETA